MPAHPFTCTRATPISLVTLNAALKAIDPTIGAALLSPGLTAGPVTLKKETPWTDAQIAAAQTVLDTASEPTAQVAAQQRVDTIAIFDKALVLALVDAINVLRTHPAIGLAAVTPAQAIAAIRAKAATL